MLMVTEYEPSAGNFYSCNIEMIFVDQRWSDPHMHLSLELVQIDINSFVYSAH